MTPWAIKSGLASSAAPGAIRLDHESIRRPFGAEQAEKLFSPWRGGEAAAGERRGAADLAVAVHETHQPISAAGSVSTAASASAMSAAASGSTPASRPAVERARDVTGVIEFMISCVSTRMRSVSPLARPRQLAADRLHGDDAEPTRGASEAGGGQERLRGGAFDSDRQGAALAGPGTGERMDEIRAECGRVIGGARGLSAPQQPPGCAVRKRDAVVAVNKQQRHGRALHQRVAQAPVVPRFGALAAQPSHSVVEGGTKFREAAARGHVAETLREVAIADGFDEAATLRLVRVR